MSIRPSASFSPTRAPPRLAAEHELDAALRDRLDQRRHRGGRRRAIARHEHDDVGHARQRAEVCVRAQARGAVAAGRLAQHERAGIARDLGGAIGRRAIDDDDRADRAMRQIAQQRRQARGVIARRHDDVDHQGHA